MCYSAQVEASYAEYVRARGADVDFDEFALLYFDKYPGTYTARSDNFDGVWKDPFGYRRGILMVDSFFENVSLRHVQRRELAPGEKEQNVIL